MLKRKDPFPFAAADEHALDRRRFLCAAATAAVAVLAAEWTATRRTVSRSGRVRLARTDAPSIGEARALVATNGVDALAVRVDAGTLVAFERRCPHLGCPVVWSAAHGRFECPCHRAVFDARTGHVLAGPPSRGLTPLPLEVV